MEKDGVSLGKVFRTVENNVLRQYLEYDIVEFLPTCRTFCHNRFLRPEVHLNIDMYLYVHTNVHTNVYKVCVSHFFVFIRTLKSVFCLCKCTKDEKGNTLWTYLYVIIVQKLTFTKTAKVEVLKFCT